MKNQDTLRHKKKSHFTLWVVVITLFALEACSLSVLVGQMRSFSKQKPTTVISLTEGSDITELEVGTRDEHAAYRLPYSRSVHFAPYRQGLNRMIQLDENSEKVGFWTYDENTIWSTKTDIEIFRLKHDNNNDGVFTVVTSDGDKVFAPGTENDYTFTIKNTNTVSLDGPTWTAWSTGCPFRAASTTTTLGSTWWAPPTSGRMCWSWTAPGRTA